MPDISWNNSENAIEFCAILEALKPESYSDFEIYEVSLAYIKNKSIVSHDNNTAMLFFNWSNLLSFQLSGYLKNFPFGTIRDMSFYLNCKFPRAAWPLRLPLSLIMIWEGLPGSKWSPWFGRRWWIRRTLKETSREGNEDYTIEYFQYKTQNDTVIEWHKYSLDANLLNILRVSRLQMKWTAFVLDKISFNWSKKAQLDEARCVTRYPLNFFTWKYFRENDQHEIVKASIGRTYSSLIHEPP